MDALSLTMIRQAAKNSGLLPRILRVSSRLSSRCNFSELGTVSLRQESFGKEDETRT